MSDRAVAVLGVLTALGAMWARPVPVVVGVVSVVVGLLCRRWWVLVAAAFLLASGLSARAWAGLSVAPQAHIAAVVTLLSDPTPVGSGERLTARYGRKHIDVVAHGSGARKLARLLAGDRVWIEGDIKVVPGRNGRWLAQRHVVGRVEAVTVGDSYDGAAVFRSANRVRRAIERGAQVMTPAERALFSGFVLGDDRAEPSEVVDEFRATGLSHLTAVSGENVAFVLVAAGPFLRRLTIKWRWLATIGLVVWFAMLTRFEPSVLRACAMATVSVTAWALARPTSTLRMLGLAATAMMLADPFLVYSAGWWLSVGATFGIALLAGPISARIPGPRGLALAIGVTLAAQIGVAPVQLAVFGGLPVVSLPANLLAVPAAGPVMIWGLPAGLLAGFVPRPVAVLLHLPSRACIRWIALVARLAARLPLGTLQVKHVIIAVVAVGAARLWRRRPVGRMAALGLASAVAISVLVGAQTPPPAGLSRLGDTTRVWNIGRRVVVAVDGRAPRLLDQLRLAHVTHVDVLAATSRSADLVAASRLFQPAVLLGPDSPPGRYDLGTAVVEVVAYGNGIDLVVTGPGREDSS